jgi:hypothetical protein
MDSSEGQRRLGNRLRQLEHLERLAETGIRDLHDFVARAYSGLEDKVNQAKAPIVITPISPVRDDAALEPVDAVDRPVEEVEGGPFGRGYRQFEWRLEFRRRYLLRFVMSVGWRPLPEAVIARCEVLGPNDESLQDLYLVRQENQVNWFTASGDLTPLKSVNHDDLRHLLLKVVETQLRVFGTAVR